MTKQKRQITDMVLIWQDLFHNNDLIGNNRKIIKIVISEKKDVGFPLLILIHYEKIRKPVKNTIGKLVFVKFMINLSAIGKQPCTSVY